MGGRKINAELRALRREPRVRILFWTALVAVIFGALDLGKQIDQTLRLARHSTHLHSVRGDVAIVGIDDRSLDALRQWPWQRSLYARLADRLRESGARRVFFDVDFALPTQPAEDQALADALRRLGGRATLAVRFVIDPVSGQKTDSFPLPMLSRWTSLASINVRQEAGAVWSVPYALSYAGKDYPSFAAALARTSGPTGTMFPIDYSLRPQSVPVVSAIDVLQATPAARALRGKDVVIAGTSARVGDIHYMPGYGSMSGAYFQVLGADTLKTGHPVVLGWLLPALAALAAAAACLLLRRLEQSFAVFTVALVAFLLGPIALELAGIYADVVPALVLLIGATAARAWQTFRTSYRERGTINPVSGLPNLNALRRGSGPGGAVLIAARVQNYAQICAALEVDEERTLARQIASRLSVGGSADEVFQGDEGIFAWFRSSQEGLDEHLSALHALFRSPVAVLDNHFDLAITFGVDISEGRSLASRLGGALSAADEAAGESRKWKRYDPGNGDDAAWRLSILSQLDAAIGAGDLWVAYQPKFDVRTREAVGAEALVRWTHPTKGPISPMEFIPAAEQSGRIEKLTEFVLDRAIRAGSLAVQRCPGFNMSVNLSPKLLGAFPLEAKVLELLAAYGLPPECLTLEVTETAALARGEGDLAPLHRLRARGVEISIDDYGTGLSTLDYIKRLPATEIKIDKSFVQAVGKSQSDRLMVHSTIQLAHSLGHKVVAEGVEDLSTFETLATMGCDVVQGFYFAKPMSFNNLTSVIPGWRRRSVA